MIDNDNKECKTLEIEIIKNSPNADTNGANSIKLSADALFQEFNLLNQSISNIVIDEVSLILM